jgi:hypothetical protein
VPDLHSARFDALRMMVIEGVRCHAPPFSLIGYLRNENQVDPLRRLNFENSLYRQTPGQKERTREATRIAATIEHLLKKYLGLSRKHLDKVDIAEFYTLAHSLAEMPSLFGLRESAKLNRRMPVAQLYPALATVTRSYFVDISITNLELPGDIRALVKSFSARRDAVVNFNWDEELDFFLGKGYTTYSLGAWRFHLEHGKRPRFLILRPHGSMGWYDLLLGLSNQDMFLIAEGDDRIPRAEKRIFVYSDIELPRDIINGQELTLDCPPVIMPPTFAKCFAYREQLQIWQDVLAACREATEFVFLGYSLPKDDFLTRAAIRMAIRAKSRPTIRCVVVNRAFDDALCERFRSVFGEGVDSGKNHLPWSFGCRKPRLAEEIEARLPSATITGRRSR